MRNPSRLRETVLSAIKACPQLWYDALIPDPDHSFEDVISVCARGGYILAWRTFISRAHPVIAATVIKTLRRSGSFSKELADDLIQETYLKICDSQVLKTFRSEEPNAIYGLLQTVAYSVVQDHNRSVKARKRGGNIRHVSIEDAGSVTGLGVGPGAERGVLIREIQENLEVITSVPRDRSIFWFYYRHGLTSEAIARLPGIGLTPKGVESVLHRLTREVRLRMVTAAKSTI